MEHPCRHDPEHVYWHHRSQLPRHEVSHEPRHERSQVFWHDTWHPVRHVVSQFCAQPRLQLLPQPEHVEEADVLSQLPEQLPPQSEQEVDSELPVQESLHASWHVSRHESLQPLWHPDPHPPCAVPPQLLLQLDPHPPRAVPTQLLPQSMGGVSSSPQLASRVGPSVRMPRKGSVRWRLVLKNSRRVICFLGGMLFVSYSEYTNRVL